MYRSGAVVRVLRAAQAARMPMALARPAPMAIRAFSSTFLEKGMVTERIMVVIKNFDKVRSNVFRGHTNPPLAEAQTLAVPSAPSSAEGPGSLDRLCHLAHFPHPRLVNRSTPAR